MRKPTRAQLLRESKRLMQPEVMKDIPDDVLATVRDRFTRGGTRDPYSLGNRLVSLDGKSRTMDGI